MPLALLRNFPVCLLTGRPISSWKAYQHLRDTKDFQTKLCKSLGIYIASIKEKKGVGGK